MQKFEEHPPRTFEVYGHEVPTYQTIYEKEKKLYERIHKIIALGIVSIILSIAAIILSIATLLWK